MAEVTIEQELEAIKTVIEALDPLDADTRQRVLGYAMQHLGLPMPMESSARRETILDTSVSLPPPASARRSELVDIRSLKDAKKPKTDVEMATLVAYYLKHEAHDSEHKDEIGTEDIEKYFVQAGYPLPTNKASTLPNAKKAGYLESASYGKYKLNSVGHNLVAHGMPRTENAGPLKSRRKNKGTPKRKASKKR